MRRAPILWLIAAVLATMVVAYVVIDDEPARQASPDSPATTGQPVSPSPTASRSPTPEPPGLTDGIYLVGTEIQPGTYSTTAPADHACYWARLSAFGGGPETFIAQDNLEPGEHAVVEVKSSDRGFKVSNGCTWYAEP